MRMQIGIDAVPRVMRREKVPSGRQNTALPDLSAWVSVNVYAPVPVLEHALDALEREARNPPLQQRLLLAGEQEPQLNLYTAVIPAFQMARSQRIPKLVPLSHRGASSEELDARLSEIGGGMDPVGEDTPCRMDTRRRGEQGSRGPCRGTCSGEWSDQVCRKPRREAYRKVLIHGSTGSRKGFRTIGSFRRNSKKCWSGRKTDFGG